MSRKWNFKKSNSYVFIFCLNYIHCQPVFEKDYCEVNEFHILCSHWQETFADTLKNDEICSSVKERVALTYAEKDEFVKVINDFRRQVALAKADVFQNIPEGERKKAADMMELEWSDELQRAAEELLFICVYKSILPEWLQFVVKDGERKITYQAKDVQPLRNKLDLSSGLKDSFVMEAANFDLPKLISNYPSDEKYDMFSVLSYSKSTYIGCARVTNWIQNGVTYKISELCILMPSESKMHNQLYSVGEPCSQCPPGYACNPNDALCNSTYFENNPPLTAAVDTSNEFRHNNTLKADDYCKLYAKHLLCEKWKEERIRKYKTDTGICDLVKPVTLTDPEKQDMLRVYNNIRSEVATGKSRIWKKAKGGPIMRVSDMVELEWDDELQRAAEEWLFICSRSYMKPEALVFGKDGSIQAKMFNPMYEAPFNLFSIRHFFNKEAGNFIKQNQNINNYTASEDYDMFTVLGYGRARFIGCARLNGSYDDKVNDTMPFNWEDACFVAPSETERNNNLFTQKDKNDHKQGRSLCHKESKTYQGLCEGEAKEPPKTKYKLEPIVKTADFCPNHILCDQFYDENKKNLGNETLCNNIELRPLQTKEKIKYLDVLNTQRDLLASGSWSKTHFESAADMMLMQWDHDLERMAQRLLQICSMNFVNQSLTAFGANNEIIVADVYPLFKDNSDGPVLREDVFENTIRQMITAESIKFNNDQVTNYTFDEDYDMFTTMAFAKARYVGCARVKPSWEIDPDTQKAFDYADACLVSPSERRIYNEQSFNQLYEPGSQCSMCPIGTTCSKIKDALCEEAPKTFGGFEVHENYCNLHYMHVLCPTWWQVKNEELCKEKEPNEMKEEKIIGILESYNNVRRKAAYGMSEIKEDLPSASDLVKLEWDYELQRAAHKMLEACGSMDQPSEWLRFGKYGEIQATKVVVVYNKNEDPTTALLALLKEQADLIELEIPEGNYTESERDQLFFNLSMAYPKYRALKVMLYADSRYLGCAEMDNIPSLPPNKQGDIYQVCLVAGPTNDSRYGLYTDGQTCNDCPLNFYCDDGLCKKERFSIERPDRFCSVKSEHILCKEWGPQEELGNCKGLVNKMEIQSTDKQTIENNYNNFRRGVANSVTTVLSEIGPAADMIKLEWEDELQDAAESLLLGCINLEHFNHDRLTFGRHGNLQANVISFAHNGENHNEKLLEAITQEAENFRSSGKNIHDYMFEDQHGMFSSLAFSKARYLGCARGSGDLENANEIKEICVIGEAEKLREKNDMFQDGASCSKCPDGYSCDDHLCKGPARQKEPDPPIPPIEEEEEEEQAPLADQPVNFQPEQIGPIEQSDQGQELVRVELEKPQTTTKSPFALEDTGLSGTPPSFHIWERIIICWLFYRLLNILY